MFGLILSALSTLPKPTSPHLDENNLTKVLIDASLEGNPFKPVQILKHTTSISTEQTAMRTKWLQHIGIQIVQELLLKSEKSRRPENVCPKEIWASPTLRGGVRCEEIVEILWKIFETPRYLPPFPKVLKSNLVDRDFWTSRFRLKNLADSRPQ